MSDLDNTSMTAMVEYEVRSQTTHVDEWLMEWNKRAQDAHDEEPETSAYAAAINVDAPNQVLVFERYDHGLQSLEKHVTRPAHATLIDTMGARNMTRRRVMSTRFVDIPDFGWWARSERSGQMAGAIIVILGFRFASTTERQAYQEVMAEFIAYCRANEPDTLIYSGGLAVSDADRELELGAGDMVFVTACVDGKALQQHADDPEHLALSEKMNAVGIDLVPTFMRTYRTTGDGYLWRN